MNNEPMECPNCKEITLTHFNTETDSSVGTFEEWRCKCGHYQTMDVPKVKKRTAGFDDFLADLGYDFIDRASKIDLAELAFVEGGTYALRQVRIDKDDISLLKRQAE